MLFARLKKGNVLLRLEPWPQCFEKSATELKQQKLLKCKQTIQIVTFNVRTLNRIGQLPELTASAVEHKIDMICIQEHRYMHNKDIKYHNTGNGWMPATVSAWKNIVNATAGGVGILIGPRVLANIYLKEQTEFIQNQIDKIRDSVEDRQSRIAWQTINKVSRRKSTDKGKLKVTNQ